jgi:anti-sigma regulatory factor (Ser/Thr protein kinase)
VTTAGFVHDALLFASYEELLAVTVPFLHGGLHAGEAAVVVATERIATLLRDALGADSGVRFASGDDLDGSPPQALPAYRELLEHEVAAGARQVRAVYEIRFGDNPADWAEWARYDAALNQILAPYPVWNVCVYDTRQVAKEVLAAAELTHPHLRTPAGCAADRSVNPRYLDPAEFMRGSAHHRPEPSIAPTLQVDDLVDLRDLRRQLQTALTGSALPAGTRNDFAFAVSEVATNAVRHGRPPVLVRLWSTPSRLVCTVTDHGSGIQDPFAGYVPAHRDPSRGGLGLWITRRLCDHVDLRTTAEGFTVQLETGSA